MYLPALTPAPLVDCVKVNNYEMIQSCHFLERFSMSDVKSK